MNNVFPINDAGIVRIRIWIRELFFGKARESILFNRVLFIINILVFSIFAIEAVFPQNTLIKGVEILFGVLFIAEYGARFFIAPKKIAYIFDAFSLVDLIVIISLFIPTLIGNLAILRIIRSLKILRSYRLLEIIGKESTFIQRNRDMFVGVLNFIVFLFVTTIIVFVSQAPVNPAIENYVDALYFTVATLTTTGYGDITVIGTGGKLMSVFVMIIGVSLFVKLARSVLRGPRAHYTCPDCGLKTHEIDASHCKHCGHVIKIGADGSEFT